MLTEFDEIAEVLKQTLDGTGLFLRGGFHPTDEDRVPACATGAPARTVFLLGNAGPDLWRAFRAGRPVSDDAHPLDRWVMGHIRRAAERLGATAVDPMRPPHPPIQRWACRADDVYPSPLGLVIHPEHGLWHAYRGALLLPDRIALPQRREAAPPCETCRTKPCLRACPVGAFQPDGFRMDLCVDHVESDDGAACRRLGCLARRACPVGREWRYPDDACAYHMQAVVGTVRRMQEKGE